MTVLFSNLRYAETNLNKHVSCTDPAKLLEKTKKETESELCDSVLTFVFHEVAFRGNGNGAKVKILYVFNIIFLNFLLLMKDSN